MEARDTCDLGGRYHERLRPRAKHVVRSQLQRFLCLSLIVLPELVAESVLFGGPGSRTLWETQYITAHLFASTIWPRTFFYRSAPLALQLWTKASHKPQIPGWDKSQATWADYVRRVNWSGCAPLRRISVFWGQLIGRAWEVSTEPGCGQATGQRWSCLLLGLPGQQAWTNACAGPRHETRRVVAADAMATRTRHGAVGDRAP